MPLWSPLELVEASARRAEERPQETAQWTVPQRDFYHWPDPAAAWIDGNGLGKSHILAKIVVDFVRGVHPVFPRRPPVRALVMGESFEQMEPLQEKIWGALPKDEIDPSTTYEEGRGISGKPPRVRFVTGRAKGSRIAFATYSARSRRIAGGQWDLIVLDEPPDEGVYGEVVPRLFRRKGVLRVGFTPVPDMRDVSWFRGLCDAGKVRKLTVGLSEATVWPIGRARPWYTQAEIDEYAETILPHERGMRLRGEWDPVATGRWLRHFTDDNVAEIDPAELAGWWLVVGIDHGVPGGKQCAVLVAVRGRNSERPEVVWLDEAINDGLTSPEDDAGGIVDMLARNGLRVEHVDDWVGDIATESRRWGVKKGNAVLAAEIARVASQRETVRTGRPVEVRAPQITAPDKGRGSLARGMSLLNTLAGRTTDEGRRAWRIRPRCKGAILGARTFDGDPKHKSKDVLDAGRYATERGCVGYRAPALTLRYG